MVKGPVIEMLAGSRCVLKRDYRVTLENDAVLTIRRGYVFDGASIPRLFWRVAGHPFEMPLLVAATCHDALYSAELFARGECDRVFRELMRRTGIGRIKRNVVWMAVRAAGWAVWNRHTAVSVAESRGLAGIEVVG